MSGGRLAVVGLGPGAAGLMAPAARAELDRAQDIVGYTTYVLLAGPFRPDQIVHASDNRHELQRARAAFALAAQGRQVAVVSSGDPGVFAMAAAVLEVLDTTDDPAWRAVDLAILPGISAAQAAASLAGAPLGHDFCVVSLSDNLKPWELIERRLAAAAAADFVLALYNPVSLARPWQFDRALNLLRRHRAETTPVVLGRDIGRTGESLTVTTIGAVRAAEVDMRTVVIVGSSLTRTVARPDGRAWVYTPRYYRGAEPEESKEGQGSALDPQGVRGPLDPIR
jgi:precorrin-3B C17-methyltransferase